VRHIQLAWLLPFCMLPLQSATLERLTLTDMIAKSTAIVRGKVQTSYAAFSGRMIFTHYSVQVAEQLKGAKAATVDVAIPGGTANGTMQTFAGAPGLQAGQEYVFFLWTDKSGLNWIIGLSQGLFAESGDPGNPSLTRGVSQEVMLDPTTHRPVQDQTVSTTLTDLRSQIAAALGGSN